MKIMIFRHRDINLQLAAGQKEGNRTIKLGGLNGLCSSYIYDKTDNNSIILNITVKTMLNICNKYVPSEVQIQFCKIDVEGAEKYVLLGFDFINYRPKVFCIETLINAKTKIPEYKEWVYILLKNDYAFAYQYRINRFYYDKRIEGLKENCSSSKHP